MYFYKSFEFLHKRMSEWKKVYDERSQLYYWNTVTNETSWTLPTDADSYDYDSFDDSEAEFKNYEKLKFVIKKLKFVSKIEICI